MNEKIDLMEEVKKIPRTGKILFTSFNFNQNFFEKYIFPRFKDKTHPLILIDYRHYISSIRKGKSSNVETRYFINPINIKGSFHPKVLLFCDEDTLKLIIGSSNITHKGYAANAEINGVIEIEYETNSSPGILTSITEFLEGMASVTNSTPHKKMLAKILNSIPGEKKHENDNIWFLHNFNKPIFNQLLEKVKNEIKEVTVISPFFSQNKKFYESIFRTFDCPIQFIVQKGNNNIPADLLKSLIKDDISFKTISFGEKRKLHAKVIIIKTNNESFCLFGSANFTKPALFLTPKEGGNVEAVILRKEMDADFFDYILKDEQIKLKSETLDKLDSVNVLIPSKESFDFTIEEATLKNNELSVKIDKEINERTKVVIQIDSLDKEIVKTIESNLITIELNDKQMEKMKNSSILSIRLEKDSKVYSSDLRWIHNPQYFPEKFSILNSIAEQDEAKWLFSLLTKIAKLPSILNYMIPIVEEMGDLGFFDFSDQEDKKEKLMKLNKKIEKLAGRKKRLKDVIEKFVHRHEIRMKKGINSKNPSNFKIVINSFIMINKLILWSVLNEYEDIQYLRKIRTNYEKLENYLLALNSPEIEERISNQRFLSNLIFITYFVDRLQILSPDFDEKDYDVYVKQVFDRTFEETLKLILKLSNKKLETISILEFKEEYEFIESRIEIDENEIKKRVREICSTK